MTLPAPAAKFIHRSAILAITLLAFALRLFSLTRFNFHIDEFFTLAAAKFITQTGAPTYPTGLFYDPGLIFSYQDALLFRLFGFSEALGRWPSVLFGTLAVVTVYWLGARALRSPGVGLLAAFWLAVSFDSLVWSGRARMITLAQWLGLLAVALLWLGLTRNSTRYRLGFVAAYGLTLFTHLSTVVLMPGWVVAAAALGWAKAIRPSRALLRDASLLLAMFGLVIAAGVYFQPPPSPDFAIGATNLADKTDALSGKFLQFPSDVGHAWDTYGQYFLALPHGPILALALFGLAVSGWRLVTHRPPAPPKGGEKSKIPPFGGSGGPQSATSPFPIPYSPVTLPFDVPRTLRYLTIFLGTVIIIGLPFYLLNPSLIWGSQQISAARQPWETVWALIDGNYDYGIIPLDMRNHAWTPREAPPPPQPRGPGAQGVWRFGRRF
jgi:hypothetical protein